MGKLGSKCTSPAFYLSYIYLHKIVYLVKIAVFIFIIIIPSWV
jgi:hypothetical protein